MFAGFSRINFGQDAKQSFALRITCKEVTSRMSLISVGVSDRYKWLKFRILSLVLENPRFWVAELGTLSSERMLLWRTSPLLYSEKDTVCSNFRGLTCRKMSLCMKKN